MPNRVGNLARRRNILPSHRQDLTESRLQVPASPDPNPLGPPVDNARNNPPVSVRLTIHPGVLILEASSLTVPNHRQAAKVLPHLVREMQ